MDGQIRSVEGLRYLSDQNFEDYINWLETTVPWLLKLMDTPRFTKSFVDSFVMSLETASWEFEDVNDGGRGAAYNEAQISLSNRITGMKYLLELISQSHSANDTPVVLDVLAGDGTIARFVDKFLPGQLSIISADLSRLMIDECIRQGLPTIRQNATQSLLANETIDAGLIAYGSHHLDELERKLAVSELHRCLRPGGRIILHDFEEGELFAKWFNHVVHPFSRTGHPHPHFTKSEMSGLLQGAGYKDIEVFEIDDRFTLTGDCEDSARCNAVMHMINMYDLINLPCEEGNIIDSGEAYINEYLGPIEYLRNANEYSFHRSKASMRAWR